MNVVRNYEPKIGTGEKTDDVFYHIKKQHPKQSVQGAVVFEVMVLWCRPTKSPGRGPDSWERQ